MGLVAVGWGVPNGVKVGLGVGVPVGVKVVLVGVAVGAVPVGVQVLVLVAVPVVAVLVSVAVVGLLCACALCVRRASSGNNENATALNATKSRIRRLTFINGIESTTLDHDMMARCITGIALFMLNGESRACQIACAINHG